MKTHRLLVGGLIAIALAFAGCGESESEPSSATSSAADTEALQDRVDELEREAQAREEAAARRERAARKREKAARKREREARTAARKARAEKRRAEKKRAAAASSAAPAPSSSPKSGDIVVPDVVGLDHQAAQDALQGEGLYSLDERDCSGQGRALLFDRNWEVVSTDPPAGSQVSEDQTITLCSVKQGEQ